ncbi:hypothetical protein BE04_18095 [Sorangium cellulosum]|uniref:Uncharacterized protein n=2 Tax=Sorangium cellulosum TaxID=56 RepID=A0A150TNL3_SORCE|nr:hypothetical protein [Sorangium cellulosum]AGP35062.1 hypothetical protein SCE1572_11405 [Sorangium cellulosum So0157-2]KYF62205.1 hypothetical protein BE04_18095 [Sorangium cellulosum]KYG06289.1 hypothetical protein BE21_35625 [Sorangium cellulosum]
MTTMNLLARSISAEQRIDEAVLCANVPSPLSSVAFHQDVECIQRFFAAGFPVHLAVHRVDSAEPARRDYTALHTHDVPEINLILPDPTGLEYRIELGSSAHLVTGSTSIWIPPGVPHSANVVQGSGYLVTVRLDRGGAT